jgi:hypothetical protein
MKESASLELGSATYSISRTRAHRLHIRLHGPGAGGGGISSPSYGRVRLFGHSFGKDAKAPTGGELCRER